jgi:hypothetical protein
VNLDRLEYEVRLLSHVVACSITDSQVSVLLDPRGDPDAIAVAVSGILITAGLDRPVKVMGGTAGVAPLPHRRLVAPTAVGAGVGVSVLALATAVAALAGAPPFSTPARPEVNRPVAAAQPHPTAPDLLHLALQPRRSANGSPAGSVSVTAGPTVVALPGDLVAGALAVSAGPGRSQSHAGGPAPADSPLVTPIPAPAPEPVEVIPTPTPVVAATPPRPVATPKVAVPARVTGPPPTGTPTPPPAASTAGENQGQRAASSDHEAEIGRETALRTVGREVKAGVKRIASHLRTHVRQAPHHESD